MSCNRTMRQQRRLWVLLIHALLVIGAAHAESRSSLISKNQPIKIGLLTSLSDDWASVGKEILRGAELALEKAEQEVAGNFKYELLVEDTAEAHNGSTAVTAYQSLRARGVTLFIGPVGTPAGLALAPLVQRDSEVLMISPTVGLRSFSEASTRMFNSWGVDEEASRLNASDALAAGVHEIAILASQQPWEEAQGKAFANEFTSLGGKILEYSSPASDCNDLRPFLTKLLAKEPKVIFLANFNRMALAAQQLRQLGFKGDTRSVVLDPDTLNRSAGALEGNTFFTRVDPNSSFTIAYTDRFHEAPSMGADTSYDAAQMILQAIQATHSQNAIILSNYLAGANIIGSGGSLIIGKDRIANRKIKKMRVKNNQIAPES